jgi:hypothetical protein
MHKPHLLRCVTGLQLVGLLLTSACVAEPDRTNSGALEEPDEAEEPTATPTPASATLLFLDGRTLMRYDIESGKRELLARLPVTDAVISPDGSRYVFVKETAKNAYSDAYVKPRLRLVELHGNHRSRDLGPGRGPVWSPDGERVAAITKARGYLICPTGKGGREEPQETGRQGCRPAERVVAYEAKSEGGGPGKSSRVLLGAERRWSIVDWTDNDRVAGIASPGRLQFSALKGEDDPPIVGFSPADVWGVSPVDLELFIVQKKQAFFARPGIGTSPPLKLRGKGLGEGSWAADGSRVAAVLVGTNDGPQLGVIDVESAEVTTVPGSGGAQGDVVWGPDGRFVYTRALSDSGNRFESVMCSPELDCEPLVSSTNGVSLVALTP